MSDTGTTRGPSGYVGSNELGEIWPKDTLKGEPLEDNSKTPLCVEEELMLAVAKNVVDDIDAIHVLDQKELAEDTRRELLENFWSAKRYIASTCFEEDCALAGINVEAARRALAPRIKAGRGVYGRWVRTVESISLDTEDYNTE